MATPEERKEIDDLHSLFGHSEVPRGMFLKFEVSRHNREIADRGRREKEQRQQLLEERREEQNRKIENLRNKWGQKDQDAVARLHANNRKNANRVKAEEAAWEQEVMAQRTALKQKVANRGSAGFHNARLAAEEEEMLRERRNQAQAE